MSLTNREKAALDHWLTREPDEDEEGPDDPRDETYEDAYDPNDDPSFNDAGGRQTEEEEDD
jgi:hypothetical protein